MKKYLLILLLPLFMGVNSLSGTLTQGASINSQGSVATSYQCTDATHDGANTAITLCEDFDGSASCADGYSSTCRNTWTVVLQDGDTIDFDNAASPSPLLGTYSFRGTSVGTTSSYAYIATGTLSNAYLHARINFDSVDTSPEADYHFLRITRSDGGSLVCTAVIDNTTGRFGVFASTYTFHESLQPSADTTYYIWLEHIKDTSCSLYVSTTPTKPETATVTKTGLNYDATGIKISPNETADMVVDHIRINSSAIGSNPQ